MVTATAYVNEYSDQDGVQHWSGYSLSSVGWGDGGAGHVSEATPDLYTIVTEWLWFGGVVRPEYITRDNFYGSGFIYDASGALTGGVVTGWDETYPYTSTTRFSISGLSLPGAVVADGIARDASAAAIVFEGDDIITAVSSDDHNVGFELFGFDGSDTITGSTGEDFISGGTPRRITASAWQSAG